MSEQGPKLDTYYEFFPSVRAGYRPTRKYGDSLKGRTRFGVELTVEGRQSGGNWEEAETTPSTEIRMYGPGDVSGIGNDQVVRVEPEPDTSTMPPNYFPHVELARAGLPWLFSPVRANPDDGAKSQPWLCLVVVPRAPEGVSIESDGRKPNPALTAPQTELPPVDEAWAWAHVQVVGRLSDAELERVFTGASKQAVARLICPRNLDPNTRYVAALVPTFEPGRRVGLGKEPFDGEGEPSIGAAWDATKEAPRTLPMYHHWEFATGNEGDFESLARGLEPRNLDSMGVGKREVDLSDPGPPAIEDPDGTFEVGGALVSPGLQQKPFPKTQGGKDREKRLALRQLLNTPDAGEESPLPVVGPPIYGRWYLPGDANWQVGEEGMPEPPGVPTAGPYFSSWFHELNVDPRWRIPAGYGTEVIQENQETLMEAAWKQFGDLERVNERVGRGQVADVAGGNATDRFHRSGDHAVGVSQRVTDAEELEQQIEAAQWLEQEGALEAHRTEPPIEEEIAASGASDDRQLATRLQEEGKLAVDSDAANLDSPEATRRVNELRLKGSTGTMRGDGGGAAVDPTAAARFESLTSPTYRRLTRSKGKLDRGVETSGTKSTFTERLGQPFSFGTDENLGTRFARASRAETDETTQPPEPDTSEDRGGDVGGTGGGSRPADTGSAPGDGGRRPAATAWRVDAHGNVMTLAEAVEELDGSMATVPKALLAVESARDHCETARERLMTIETELTEAEAGAEFPRAVVAAVTERPTVEQQCAVIRDNTFDVLDRQFGKLVASRPAPLADDFTQAEKQARFERVRGAHDRLTAAVTYVTDAVRSRSDEPSAVREKVAEALSAVDDIKLGLEELAEPIDRGIPADPSGQGSSPSATRDAAEQPPEELEMEATALSAAPGTTDTEFATNATAARRQLLFDGTETQPGLIDASSWAKRRTARDVHPGLLDRDLVLDRIVGSPEFEQPTYRWLADLDEQYLLPGVDEIPADTIGAMESNSEFIESFMCGLNHEMARELQWRRFPNDRRGTYFRQFWKYIGTDQPDIQQLTEWGEDPLGGNRSEGISDDRVVLIIRGDLLRAYPNTRIYAVKAVKEDKSGTNSAEAEWDRVPLLESLREKAIEQRRNGVDESEQLLRKYGREELEQDAWDPKEPVFSGQLDPDITFLGFDLETEMAVGGTLDEDTPKDELGWFFVLEERVGETRFGLDVPSGGDYGSVPYGVRTGPEGDRSNNEMDTKAYNDGAEKGWNGLSWGHLVSEEADLDGKKYVSVSDDRPAGGDGAPWAVEGGTQWYSESGITETWNDEDTAEWGTNSAHMARITWQLPVRVCIHADDILPEMTDEGSGWYRMRGSTEVDDT